jgi:hypothetical protein
VEFNSPKYTDGTVRYDKHAFLTNTGEPTSIDEAISDKNWKAAMDLEFDALAKNKTWHLVPPMKGRNIIGCKWFTRSNENRMEVWIDTKQGW